MKLPHKIVRCDSLKSDFLDVDQLNDSVDEDDGEEFEKLTKVHILKSKFLDRPSTFFFLYPKCCGL